MGSLKGLRVKLKLGEDTMGLGKFGIGLLCLVGGSVIGAGGYSVYTHHHENQETVRVSQKSSETKSLSSNKLNSESLQSESSESQNQVEFSSRSTNNINSRSSVVANNQGNGELYNASNHTFAGYHNIHELWNSGYTVTSYLIKKCGYTADQAHNYIDQHFSEIRPFLGSGEIQTYYEKLRSEGRSINNN